MKKFLVTLLIICFVTVAFGGGYINGSEIGGGGGIVSEVDPLWTNALASGFSLNGNLVPGTSNVYNLGSKAFPWATQYVVVAYMNDLTVDRIQGGFVSMGDILPGLSNGYSLGSTDFPWAEVHIHSESLWLGEERLSMSNGLYRGYLVPTSHLYYAFDTDPFGAGWEIIGGRAYWTNAGNIAVFSGTHYTGPENAATLTNLAVFGTGVHTYTFTCTGIRRSSTAYVGSIYIRTDAPGDSYRQVFTDTSTFPTTVTHVATGLVSRFEFSVNGAPVGGNRVDFDIDDFYAEVYSATNTERIVDEADLSVFVDRTESTYTDTVVKAASALQVETDPDWHSASGGVVYAADTIYTDTVGKAASALQAESTSGVFTPYVISGVGTIMLNPTNGWVQSFEPTDHCTVSVVAASALLLENVRLDIVATNSVTFLSDNGLIGEEAFGITNSVVHSLLFDSPANNTNWYGRQLR